MSRSTSAIDHPIVTPRRKRGCAFSSGGCGEGGEGGEVSGTVSSVGGTGGISENAAAVRGGKLEYSSRPAPNRRGRTQPGKFRAPSRAIPAEQQRYCLLSDTSRLF